MAKGKSHMMPPPPPVGRGKRCCWPGCRDERLERFGDDFALCLGHAIKAYEAVAAERSRIAESAVDQALPEKDRGRARDGWIYYVQVGDRIKIGHATDVDERLKAYPPDSELLALHPGSRADEAATHQRFTPYRVAGREWYEQAAPLLRHVEQLHAEYANLLESRDMVRRERAQQSRSAKIVRG